MSHFGYIGHHLIVAIIDLIYLMEFQVITSMAISGTDLLEVPTIYKAYFLGLCKGISPQNMALYATVPPF